jgi:UDP-N-acetylmuramoyl-tripeptide--D-alanyl-D-alanine ligase
MQMIEVLARVPCFSRRILVAGEMLELGDAADALHFECGVFAADQGLDLVIGVQGAAREIVRAAAESGIPGSQVHFFDDSYAAAGFVQGLPRKGDLMLIKGSRGVHTERIVQSLRSHFEPWSL